MAFKQPIFKIVGGSAPWVAKLDPESRHWVGICDTLKLVTEAESWPEFLWMIQDVMNLFFEELLDSKELDQLLDRHAWQCVSVRSREPGERPTFDITAPITIEPEPARDTA